MAKAGDEGERVERSEASPKTFSAAPAERREWQRDASRSDDPRSIYPEGPGRVYLANMQNWWRLPFGGTVSIPVNLFLFSAQGVRSPRYGLAGGSGAAAGSELLSQNRYILPWKYTCVRTASGHLLTVYYQWYKLMIIYRP